MSSARRRAMPWHTPSQRLVRLAYMLLGTLIASNYIVPAIGGAIETFVTDGTAKRPYITYFGTDPDCTWTEADRAECAAKICDLNGYASGVIVAESNPLCDGVNAAQIYDPDTAWFYLLKYDGNVHGGRSDVNIIITVDCWSGTSATTTTSTFTTTTSTTTHTTTSSTTTTTTATSTTTTTTTATSTTTTTTTATSTTTSTTTVSSTTTTSTTATSTTATSTTTTSTTATTTTLTTTLTTVTSTTTSTSTETVTTVTQTSTTVTEPPTTTELALEPTTTPVAEAATTTTAPAAAAADTTSLTKIFTTFFTTAAPSSDTPSTTEGEAGSTIFSTTFLATTTVPVPNEPVSTVPPTSTLTVTTVTATTTTVTATTTTVTVTTTTVTTTTSVTETVTSTTATTSTTTTTVQYMLSGSFTFAYGASSTLSSCDQDTVDNIIAAFVSDMLAAIGISPASISATCSMVVEDSTDSGSSRRLADVTDGTITDGEVIVAFQMIFNTVQEAEAAEEWLAGTSSADFVAGLFNYGKTMGLTDLVDAVSTITGVTVDLDSLTPAPVGTTTTEGASPVEQVTEVAESQAMVFGLAGGLGAVGLLIVGGGGYACWNRPRDHGSIVLGKAGKGSNGLKGGKSSSAIRATYSIQRPSKVDKTPSKSRSDEKEKNGNGKTVVVWDIEASQMTEFFKEMGCDMKMDATTTSGRGMAFDETPSLPNDLSFVIGSELGPEDSRYERTSTSSNARRLPTRTSLISLPGLMAAYSKDAPVEYFSHTMQRWVPGVMIPTPIRSESGGPIDTFRYDVKLVSGQTRVDVKLHEVRPSFTQGEHVEVLLPPKDEYSRPTWATCVILDQETTSAQATLRGYRIQLTHDRCDVIEGVSPARLRRRYRGGEPVIVYRDAETGWVEAQVVTPRQTRTRKGTEISFAMSDDDPGSPTRTRTLYGDDDATSSWTSGGREFEPPSRCPSSPSGPRMESPPPMPKVRRLSSTVMDAHVLLMDIAGKQAPITLQEDQQDNNQQQDDSQEDLLPRHLSSARKPTFFEPNTPSAGASVTRLGSRAHTRRTTLGTQSIPVGPVTADKLWSEITVSFETPVPDSETGFRTHDVVPTYVVSSLVRSVVNI